MAYHLNYLPKGKHQKRKGTDPETIQRLSRQWGTTVISSLWSFSKTIWKHRNEVVHGKTPIALSKEVQQLQECAAQHYTQYAGNPHLVPHTSAYLFNRPLASILALRRDTLASWIRSVEEAVQTQQHRVTHSTKPLSHYFQPKTTGRPTSRPASTWDPPFSKAYYKKHNILYSSRKTRTTQMAPIYRHPAYIRCRATPTTTVPNQSPAPPPARRPTDSIQRTAHLKIAIRSTRSSCRPHLHKKISPCSTATPLTLHHFGFSRGSSLPNLNPTKRLLDTMSEMQDYSGTYLSTAP